MSDTNDGGQAFPCMYPNAHNTGMSLRDYFAARVLPTILEQFESGAARGQHGYPVGWRESLALQAYTMADVMIEARANPQRKDGDE